MNMINETTFHRLTDQWLKQAEAALEEADASGAIEVEYHNDALTILLPAKKTLLISKHATTRQLWLASPLSGGLHFIYGDGQWKLEDGRTLEQVVRQELKTLGGVEIAF
jgi:iron donor protein CyaY